MATPRKKATPSRKESRSSAKKQGSRPAKTIEIPYKPAPDFRYVPSTGALIRANPEGAVITFYVDDNMPVSQTGKLVEHGEGYASYEQGKLNEEICRWLQVGVRVSLPNALALANLLVQKVAQADPAFAKEAGITLPEAIKKE